MLTDILSVIAAFTLTVIAELVKLVKSKKVLFAVGGVTAAFILVILGYSLHLMLSKPATTDPSPSSTPASTTTRLGLDLAQYCDSYGYENNTEGHCYSNIDLNKACNWQYDRNDLHIEIGDDPNSGKCHDAKGNYVGGIEEMPGYCSDSFKRSASVNAVVRGKTWVCQVTIDHNLACQWQYQTKNLVARKEGGLWGCLDT